MHYNKQYGSAHNYISNEEWIGANKLANFKMINVMTNITLNKYKPILLNINKNIATVLGETPINMINNVHKNNSNRKKIQSILRDEDSSLIITEVIELRNKLEEQSENISNLITDHLDINDYASFLKDLSAKTKKFTFMNVDQVGDVPKDLTSIQNFGDKVMKILPEIEGEEIINKIKVEKEYIQYSISSGLCWKYVDLTKHAIGTLEDIMRLAVMMLQNENKDITLDSINLRKIYEPYIDEKDRNEFFDSIRLRGYTVKGPGSNGIMIFSNELSASDTEVKTYEDYTPSTQNIITLIQQAVIAAEEKVENNIVKTAREFLVVVIADLLDQVRNNLTIFNDEFKNFQKRKYDNKYNQIYKNISSNIKIFGSLIDNTINNFFGLNNRDISAYGIDRGTPDINNPKPTSIGSRISVRVIGGQNKIKSLSQLKVQNYPLIGTADEMINRLVDMIGASPKLDIVDKKPLAMGGFIQKEFIGRTSIKIVHDYFERLLKNKDINIKYIDQILERMRKGVHIKDLRNIRSKIDVRFKEIGKISDPVSKALRAKTASQFIGNEYKRLRNYELDNLLSLDMIEATIRNNPNKLATMGKRISKLRDAAFTKFGHYQLKSHAYKTIALGSYQQLIKNDPKKYPVEIVGQLHEVFNKMDDRLLKDLSNKAEDKYDRLKDKLLDRIITKDISVLNSTFAAIPSVITNKNEYISNINTILTARDWKIIESKEYWEKVKKKLDGLTIYIPYVDISILELGHQHGLFDLINAAIEGKIRESYLVSKITDHIIPGSRLDRKTISRRVRAQGTVMVTNGEREIKDPRLWRNMIKGDINDMKKLGAADLRHKIFTIFSNKAAYIMNTPYLWPDNSYTKEKIILYCRMTFSTNNYYQCALLTSRNRVANKMLGI